MNFIPFAGFQGPKINLLALKTCQDSSIATEDRKHKSQGFFFLQKVTLSRKYFIAPVPWENTWISMLL